jgi:hypothetical protein
MSGHRPERRPLHTSPAIRILSAQNIAKAHRAAAVRSHLAAQYVLGYLLISEPTEALAARIFGISPPSVSCALAKLRTASPANAADFLAFWWGCATPAHRDAFMRANLVSAWDSIDRVTR